MNKRIPKFQSESEERLFWQTHDSTEYVDWSKAERTFLPRLKPTGERFKARTTTPETPSGEAQKKPKVQEKVVDTGNPTG